MYVVAIITASYIINSEVRRKKIPLTSDNVTNLMLATIIVALIVARLYYVVFNWGFYGANPIEIPAVWHGGLAIHGGIIGGLIGGWLYLKRKDVSFWPVADCVALCLIIGQAFGRFGNFMNGDAHGRPTEMPWGIVFPPESIAGSEFPGLPLHPTMLYELFINVIIFCLLWFVLRRRPQKDGFLFALYIALYSCGRLFVEHFRADSLMLGPLKAAQVVSIIIIIAMVIIIARKKLWSPSR
jgi:phosphatidylglycerol:prolipoprotein diacylglycerol transferase